MRNSIKKLNVGWLIERARFNIKERAFAEKWIELNRPDYRGVDLVQRLFLRSEEKRPPRAILTARERWLIATVIQWLGTNVGFAFLEDVLKLIGYRLTPIDRPLNRAAYYLPFEDRQESSAWYNLTAASNGREEIPSRLVRRPPKRKHLLRYFPKGFGKKVCVRCGFVTSGYGGKIEPDCKPPILPAKVTRIKKLKGEYYSKYEQ